MVNDYLLQLRFEKSCLKIPCVDWKQLFLENRVQRCKVDNQQTVSDTREQCNKMRIHNILLFSYSNLVVNCDDHEQQNCVESCKEGVQERHGEHCYYWSTRKNSWDQSKLDCENMNGSLAAITSMELHKFLMRKVDEDDMYTWFWIGGSDREKEGTWKWEDGSEWHFTNWASKPNQQPNGGKNIDCLQIFNQHAGTNGWNDISCSFHFLSICSWKICSGVTIYHC